MKSQATFLTNALLIFTFVALTYGDTPKQIRPDSHAPIGVMGDHGHKTGEMMLSYRFMTMDMRGLQSGTVPLKTADVLKDFMMVPTQMDMQMHMLGVMFAPHNSTTFMGMINYQQRNMEMESIQQHTHGEHREPVGHHEMSSVGIGDTKLEALITLWKTPDLTFLTNVGVSFRTGSIAQTGNGKQTLPYPMQLGSGSFEARPGITLFGFYNTWSYGGQLRGAFPLHTNSSEYRHGATFVVTAWGARRINNWISLSSRLLLSRQGNITGSNPDLNIGMSPSHRSDFRGHTRLDFAVSCNLTVPTGTFAGQRFAIEMQMPLYQNLNGIQLKSKWLLTLGWQYAFKVL
ncbi:MAG: transporter [Candidatus Poribacteria bacterium]|nr:transporter [Candidatus Poribacteria bacterium]